MQSIPTISVEEAASKNAPLVDVRERDEWDAGHAPAATHIPLSELAERVGELAELGDVLVICKVGGRSARATQFLIQSNISATNVEGGMLAWQAAELEMVSETAAPPAVI